MKIVAIKVDQTRKKRKYYPRLFVYSNEQHLLKNMKNFLKKVRQDIIPAFIEMQKMPPDTKAVWTRNAGCFCGCSPGFIIKTNWSYTLRDYYVRYELEETDQEYATML